MEGDGDFGVLEVTPAVHVELTNDIHVQGGAKRLVEQLNSRNSGMRGVIVADLVEHIQSVLDRIALCPANTAILARVVEAVLRQRSCISLGREQLSKPHCTYHHGDQS